MVEDGPLAAVLRVLVPQGVERVRVRGEDALELAARDRSHVLLGERCPQALLAGTADIAARRLLGVEQDPEIRSGVALEFPRIA